MVKIDTDEVLPTLVETVTLLSLVTVCTPAIQETFRKFIRPLIVFDTVQIRVYLSPALAMPDLLMLA